MAVVKSYVSIAETAKNRMIATEKIMLSLYRIHCRGSGFFPFLLVTNQLKSKKDSQWILFPIFLIGPMTNVYGRFFNENLAQKLIFRIICLILKKLNRWYKFFLIISILMPCCCSNLTSSFLAILSREIGKVYLNRADIFGKFDST